MSVATLEYLQTFKTLSLSQQMQVRQAINQYLMEYFSHLTTEIEEKERSSWKLFSTQNVAKAFGEDEPEYSISVLSESEIKGILGSITAIEHKLLLQNLSNYLVM